MKLVAQQQQKKKRFALLLACNDSDHVKKTYGGYFSVFVRAFGGEGESWDLFRVVEGEFPDMEDLESYDGFVISGSPFDAYGNEPWIRRLCFLLQTLDAMQKRVLGICFGHQVLCRALGGKVGKANGGWDLGIRNVILVEDCFNRRFLHGLKEEGDILSSISIIECHQDEVWEVPVGAQVIAFSDKTGVEVFCYGDHIMGIQGHPEYTKDILHNIVDRLFNSGSIDLRLAEDAKAKVEATEPAREFWGKMCKAFLKGRRINNK